ncbi:MAG: lysophospholipid acyltransferase family protein [Gammaproteobacteria bacterium]
MLYLRSLIFTVLFILTAFVASAIICVVGPFSHPAGFAVARRWGRLILGFGTWFCGMRYEIEGTENIPPEPSVALVKHSSAWETVAGLFILPLHTWVLKRELMWIPIIGWALYLLRPIAIDRKAGRSAVQQVVRQGADRLAHGLWIIVFPEGTRMPPGQTRRYGVSGALLAKKTGCPLVPVAHNAGDFWRRRGLLKKPGLIRVVIGTPIPTAGRDPREINAEAQEWVETTMARISNAYPPTQDSPDLVSVQTKSS